MNAKDIVYLKDYAVLKGFSALTRFYTLNRSRFQLQVMSIGIISHFKKLFQNSCCMKATLADTIFPAVEERSRLVGFTPNTCSFGPTKKY